MRATRKRRATDPFIGCEDGNVRCEWFDERSNKAQVVRLIVDHERWDPHWPNAAYQLSTIETIRNYVAATLPSAKLILCPAGMITVGIDASTVELLDRRKLARELSARMAAIRWGKGPAVLLGVDGVIAGVSTPLQGTMLVKAGGSAPTPDSLALKLYPADHEISSLIGWRLITNGEVDPLDLGIRQLHVGSLKVSTIICHEAVAFSGRSAKKRAKGSKRHHVARYLGQTVAGAQYIAMATHWADQIKGRIFIDAARKLAERSGAAVAMSMFAPSNELEIVASRFQITRSSTLAKPPPIATLLVRHDA